MKSSVPKILLHFEGLAVLVTACVLYGRFQFSWLWFAITLLAPDLAMLGYLANKRVGAACYNAAHTTIAPFCLLIASQLFGRADLLALVLIWFAHIGMDRACGYGLKYETSFRDSHMQKV